MRPEVTSKNLLGVTELTLKAKIKPGLVYGLPRPMTYANRLRILLNLFYSLRKTADEREGTKYAGPVERLRMVHELRWTVADDDTQLLLTVSFDQSWESYIRSLVDNVGPALDIILCHCSEYDGKSCLEGFPMFERFARDHQIVCDFFYSAESRLTADDVRLLKHQDSLLAEPLDDDSLSGLREELATTRIGSRDAEGVTPPDGRLRLLSILHRLSPAFPSPAEPEPNRISPNDGVYYRRFARALLREALPESFLSLHNQFPSDKLLGWYKQLTDERQAELDAPPKLASRASDLRPDDLTQVQGNILASYKNKTHGLQAYLEIKGRAGAQQLLKTLQAKLTTADVQDAEVTYNVAFSPRGLARLGLPKTLLDALPKEFRDGMAARSGILGDVGRDHPENWTLPQVNWPAGTSGPKVPLDNVDMMVMVQCGRDRIAADDHRFTANHPLFGELNTLLSGDVQGNTGVKVLWVEPLLRKVENGYSVGHFGYTDGISQPNALPDAPENRDQVAPGEVLLRHVNERNEVLPPDDLLPEGSAALLANGSFLVLRKLRQNVATFQKFVENNKAPHEGVNPDRDAEQRVKGQLMGRYPDGTPLLAEGCPSTTENNFDFEADPQGAHCPLHSHIRRANPREVIPPETSARLTPWTYPEHPRLIRRGFSYGAPVSGGCTQDGDRGLMFMGFNARIAEQFEVVQRWLNGGNSTGILSRKRDLLVASQEDEHHGGGYKVRAGSEWVPLTLPETPMVELQWGIYLFAPSKAAVGLLADYQPAQAAALNQAAATDLSDQGLALIRQLLRIDDTEAALTAWQRLLEDDSRKDEAEAVWAAIRNRNGFLDTPYGVLVGNHAGVRHVLGDETCFSVRTYWERMEDSLGGGHLGLDSKRSGATDGHYEAIAPVINPLIRSLDMKTAFELSRQITTIIAGKLTQLQKVQLSALGGHVTAPEFTSAELNLTTIVYGVLEQVAKKLIGMPDGLIELFPLCSLYIFRPNPGSWVRDAAHQAGKKISAEYQKYVTETPAAELTPFGQALTQAHHGDQTAIIRDLVGTVLGYIGPTAGSALSVLQQWIASRDLWSVQRQLHGGTLGYDESKAVLLDQVQTAMAHNAVPNLLHRVTSRRCPMSKNVPFELPENKRVVVSLQSALQEQPEDMQLLFGGHYDEETPIHACAGRDLALGSIMGIIAGVATLEDLAPTSEPSVLRYRPATTA